MGPDRPKPQPSRPSPDRPFRRLFWPAALIACAAAVAGSAHLLLGHFAGWTNDASIEADVVALQPKVPGYVAKLDVDDNARFKAGDELLEIDPRDYANAVASAEADLASARAGRDQALATLTRQGALIKAAEAALSGDRSDLVFAGQQVQRYGPLSEDGFGSVEHLQQVQAEYDQRHATLQKDAADLKAAQDQLVTLRAEVSQATAEIARRQSLLDQARLNLSHTRIRADFDGSVADRIVRAGAYVQPGQTLLSEVPTRPYVIANYKEDQLAQIHVGQRVWIRVDSFPGVRFGGRIDSLQRGTGSRFALLPPENATGNFVKVVQRVPIKIVFDAPGHDLSRLAPGMSVETQVERGPDA